MLAKLIFDKGKRHISAENLFDEVKKDERKISMATIYNTLKQFTSLGLLKKLLLIKINHFTAIIIKVIIIYILKMKVK